MSFRVETDNLRTQAEEWTKRQHSADTVRAELAPAVGQGADFGFLAGGAGVSEAYDAWTRAMEAALQDCAYSAAYLAAALGSAAAFYDESDATAATDMAELDRKLEASGYQQ